MNGEGRHDEMRENIPAFILGGLTPEEEEALREHLRSCEECRQEMSSYEPLLHALNLPADDAPLPAGARERLLERATERTDNVRTLPTAASPPGAESVGPSSHPSGRPSRLPWALAAASLLLAVLLAGFFYQQNRQLNSEVADQQQTISSVVDLMERPDLRVEDLSTPDSEARARVYAAREGDVGMLVFDRLPPLPENKTYQLWVGGGDALRSAGTFEPTSTEKGSYHKLLSPPGGFDEYDYVGVTASPKDGLQEAPPPSAPEWVIRAEIPSPAQASRS